MFSQLKVYALGVLGLVVAVFGAIFTFRGRKIERLQQDVKVEQGNRLNAERAAETQKAVNEKFKDYSDVDEKIMGSGDADVVDRLSGFNRD